MQFEEFSGYTSSQTEKTDNSLYIEGNINN